MKLTKEQKEFIENYGRDYLFGGNTKIGEIYGTMQKEIERKDYLLKEQGKELKDLYKEIEKLVDELGEQERHIKEANFEIERLHSIIKEVREYIEEHSEMTDLQINGIENILAFRGSCKKLLEILDKVEENK